jgi:Spy/CpxP family protein refolding chaperone
MKTKNLLFGILAFIFVTSFTTQTKAFAHDESGHEASGHKCLMAQFREETGGFLTGFKEDLKLTDEQIVRLKQISAETCKKMHGKKEVLSNEKEKLHNLMTSADIDVDTVKAQLKKVYDMECSFKCEVIAEFQKAREVLTKEQKSKLPEILKAHNK